MPMKTWAPWNPVNMKKPEAAGLVEIVMPSWTNSVNSKTWPPMNTMPSMPVANEPHPGAVLIAVGQRIVGQHHRQRRHEQNE